MPRASATDAVFLALSNPTRRRVVERLKRASDAHRWESEAAGLKVTLSIGLALRARGATIATTIAAADEALYEAKAAGGSTYRLAVADSPWLGPSSIRSVGDRL